MRTFEFYRAASTQDAIARAATGATYYAGGTNLLDLMKRGVEEPASLVDIGRLDLRHITTTERGGVLIGAGTTNSAIANHHLIRSHYPVLSQAILSGATTQLRNMATAGGNLMQRTRCAYFMDPAFPACNKRQPGSGCAALTGFNREHALFGAGDTCAAVHPSDMAVALAILDAVVHVESPAETRVIPIGEFFRLPHDDPQHDNSTRPGELITGIELPPSPYAQNYWYLKVRDRHSYAFALVSVAVGLAVVDETVESVSIALGGVAAMPWRVTEAEAALTGKAPVAEHFLAAAELALEGAVPLSQNGFKVDLAKHSVMRALHRAAARTG
ncbi:xanthine dehydrogenase family protein subunit M [Mycobacterium sp. TY814]|uniref:FAD binding domain-containing protein n=1 Tax=unclassified Mycobacterium TaxID=2642494 RepID=UPI002742718F|nr:xanthine dehydrogenase family protein subunit M [Mycobacterium sp. TY814]MDP7724973.1 xanthine dehydrogenase family protein subunit M [Mycobacterium sp. TY814]